MRSIFRGRATGHGRQQDDRVALGDRRLVAVAGADVLAADVDVRVLELALQAREAGGQVVEQVADGLGLDYFLALAARLGPEGGRNSNHALARTGLHDSTESMYSVLVGWSPP